jgi:acetyl-CoA acetyltransferase
MQDVVIVSTARTPLCKSWKGSLNMTHGATLGGHVVKAAIERANVDPLEVEDVLVPRRRMVPVVVTVVTDRLSKETSPRWPVAGER